MMKSRAGYGRNENRTIREIDECGFGPESHSKVVGSFETSEFGDRPLGEDLAPGPKNPAKQRGK